MGRFKPFKDNRWLTVSEKIAAEQFMPRPISNEHGENECCPDTRAWEMEMLHQVWAAGLHDAANCFQDALEAKWKLESQRSVDSKGGER